MMMETTTWHLTRSMLGFMYISYCEIVIDRVPNFGSNEMTYI